MAIFHKQLKIKFQFLYIRVPTALGKPGKMTTVFSSPGKVLEFYNFIKNPGKIGVNLEKWIVWEKIVDCCNIHFCCIGLCPLKCTFGRNSGIVALLWCFQMARYMGQIGLACLWIPRREIEPQLLVAPSVSSEACPHCIYHWLTLPREGGGLA